jgi:hypothetical protein
MRRLPTISPMKYRMSIAPMRAAALLLLHSHTTPAGASRKNKTQITDRITLMT